MEEFLGFALIRTPAELSRGEVTCRRRRRRLRVGCRGKIDEALETQSAY